MKLRNLKTSLSIFLYLFVMAGFWKTTNSTSFRTLSEGTNYSLNFLENGSRLNVNVSFDELKSFYLIDGYNDFVIPHANCECSCAPSVQPCSDETEGGNINCASRSDESTCVSYFSDAEICPEKRGMCCRIHFSKNSTLKNAILNLVHRRSSFRFFLAIKKSSSEEVFRESFDLPDGVKRILVSPDLILEVSDVPVPVIASGSYYAVDKSNKLTQFKEKNGHGRFSFEDAAWYSLKPSQLFSNQKPELQNFLEILPLISDEQNQLVNCSLNEGHRFGWVYKDIKPLSEYYSALVPNVSLQVNGAMVAAVYSIPPTLNANIKGLLHEPFLYNSFISNRVKPNVTMEFLNGSGSFEIEIFTSLKTFSVKYNITVSSRNAHAVFPLPYDFSADEHASDVYVCTYQNDVQLCQRPEIFPKNNFPTNIPGNNTDEISTVRSTEKEKLKPKQNLSARKNALTNNNQYSVYTTVKNTKNLSIRSATGFVHDTAAFRDNASKTSSTLDPTFDVGSYKKVAASTKSAIYDSARELVNRLSNKTATEENAANSPIRPNLRKNETEEVSIVEVKNTSDKHNGEKNTADVTVIIIGVVVVLVVIILIMAYIRRKTLPCNMNRDDEVMSEPKNNSLVSLEIDNVSLIEMNPLLPDDLIKKSSENEAFQYTMELKNTLKDTQKRLGDDLINRYMSLEFPHYSWMKEMKLNYDNYYTKVSMIRKKKSASSKQQWRKTWQGIEYHQVDESGKDGQAFYLWQNNVRKEDVPSEKQFSFYRILEDSEQQHPQKILVEGEAGSGKTTSVFKIAYDWANAKTYVSHFDAVFVIRLRDLKDNLDQYLTQEYFPSMASDFLFLIHSNQTKVLLLMDGYDEINEDGKKTVTELLSGRCFSNASVVITSKPEALNDSKSEVNLSVPDMNRKSFNKTFTFIGIRGEDKHRFLLKYIFDNDDSQIFQVQTVVNELPADFPTTPLLLLLAGILAKKTDQSWPSNKAGLYKNIYDLIIDTCVRLETINENETPIISETLKKFERNCLVCLIEDRKFFKIDEFSLTELEQLRSAGFLYDYFQRDDNTIVHPIHISLIEYMGTKFLWKIRHHEEFELALNAIKNINLFNIEYSLLVPFLFVLFREESRILLRGVSQLSFYYSFDLISLWNCVKNREITEELIISLEPFIPDCWEIGSVQGKSGFSISEVHSALLTIGVETAKIKTIQWDVNCATYFPVLQYKIQNLDLNLLTGVLQSNIDQCKFIQCETLHVNVNFSSKQLLHHEWNRVCEAITNIKSESVSFNIFSLADEVLRLVWQGLQSGRLKVNHFQFLLVQLNLDNTLALRPLEDIINNNKVKNIQMILNVGPNTNETSIGQKHIDQLVQSLSRIPCVRGFSFENCTENSFTVNLNILTNGGKKKFDFLLFHRVGLITIEEKNVRKRYKIDRLKVSNDQVSNFAEANVISKCSSEHVECNIEVINALVYEVENFSFSDIHRLDILLNCNVFTDDFFLCVEKFADLQTLTICLTSLKRSVSYEQPTTNIVTVIEKLKLQEFVILDIEKCPLLAFALLDKLLNFLIGETPVITLQTLTIGINGRGIPTEKTEEKLSQLSFLLKKAMKVLNEGGLKLLSLNVQGSLQFRKEFSLILAKIFKERDRYIIEWYLDEENSLSRNVHPKILDWFLFKTYRFDVQLCDEEMFSEL